MVRKRSLITKCLLLLVTSGCASSQLRVESVPEGADVSVVRANQSRQVIGKTPLVLDERSNPEVFANGAQLEVFKADHLPESIVLPRTNLGAAGRLQVALKPNALPESCKAQTVAASNLARGVAEAQSYIIRRNFSQAETVLRNLTEAFPNVSVLYDLLGNLYYMQKDVKRALTAYRRSNEVDPNNPETTRMIDKLSIIRGQSPAGESRQPAAQGG